jgi:parvulin-like peptidyl-prolyl isomerase
MNRFVRVIAAVAASTMLVAVLAGCSGDWAAKVNGQEIPKSELDAQFDVIAKQYPQMFQGPDAAAREADFRKRLLDNLVDQKLVEQAAKDQGVTVTDAEVDKQIAELKKTYASSAAFDDALKKFGTSADKLKAQIRQQLMLQKVTEKLAADQKVTPADIKAYYLKNKGQFRENGGKRVAHILVKDQKTAQQLLAQVQGGADFAALAKKYSIDPGSKAKGGDLGFPSTPYVKEFQAAVDQLTKPGQISAIIKTTYGFHIIKLIETRAPRQRTLEQVSDQIAQILKSQRQADAYQKFVQELRKKAKIEVNEALLKASTSKDGK